MDLSKTIELIEKSTHIGIIFPPTYDFDCISSAQVLASLLKERDKNVGVLNKNSQHPDTQNNFFQNNTLPKEFIISIPLSSSPVEQLRYEKKDGSVDIILKPKNNKIDQKTVLFGEGKTICDCAIILGVDDIESLNNSVDVEPNFFSETPLINVDISPDNKTYGEINLVDSQKASVAEIVYTIVCALKQEPLSKNHAQLLISAIVEKTKNLSSYNTAADTLLTISELMRLGAKLNLAPPSQSQAHPPLSLIQLMGRAAVRSRLDDNTGVLWSFITAEDFEKTERSPADLGEIFSYLDKTFPPHKVTSILWQNPHQRQIFASLFADQLLLNTLSTSGKGTFQSPYLLLEGSFETFRAAEEYVSLLLVVIL